MRFIRELFKKENFFIAALAAAVAASPSFDVGSIGARAIELRIEDVILLLASLVYFFAFIARRKIKIVLPPLSGLILVWLAIGGTSMAVNLSLGIIDPVRSFFYFLKEIEFFLLYFLVFSHIKNIATAKFAVKLWILLAGANIAWVFTQIIFKIKPDEKWGAYGPGAIGEGGPFPSGGFFAILFVFMFNLLIYYFSKQNLPLAKKIALAAAVVFLIAGVLASGSRISAGAVGAGAAVSLFAYFFKTADKFKFILALILPAAIFGGLFFAIYQQLPRAERIFDASSISGELSGSSKSSRLVIWRAQIAEVLKSDLAVVIGYGKAVILPTNWEESHNQYVRNFVDTGILGSLAFIMMLSAILIRSARVVLKEKDPFTLGMAAGLFAATISMALLSMTAEAFLSVRICETYWFLAAIAMAVISFSKKSDFCKNSRVLLG